VFYETDRIKITIQGRRKKEEGRDSKIHRQLVFI